jgi:hypothetical protein
MDMSECDASASRQPVAKIGQSSGLFKQFDRSNESKMTQ